MGDVEKSDWKLFRKRLPEWQEAYMEKLCREYMDLLSGEGLASEKFWALDQRIKTDRRCPGVIVRNMRPSSMRGEITRLVLNGVITLDDLEGFSDDVKNCVIHFLNWEDEVL